MKPLSCVPQFFMYNESVLAMVYLFSTYILDNVAILGHQMSVQSIVPFQGIIQSKIRNCSGIAHQEFFASQIIGKLQKFRISSGNHFLSPIVLK